MARTPLSLLAALALTFGSCLWSAEDAPAPTTAPAAAATETAPAPAPAKSIEDRLAELEKAIAPNAGEDGKPKFANGSDGVSVGEKAERAWQSLNQFEMNAGDNAWMLMSAVILLLMTLPGLALFYGGLVRRKNVLSTLMQTVAIAGIVSLIWCICGYSLAFGDGNAFIGSFTQYMFLTDVVWKDGAIFMGTNPTYAMSIPHGSFMLFQLMFAIITPALICGAYAERMKFTAMVLFTVLWLFIVYIPMAHMVWGNGGLLNWWAHTTPGEFGLSAFDFAGGTVVHISSGIAALMCAILLGKRKNYGKEPMPPHNLTYSFIGASLLWVGWFGFNAGSALCASGLATLAFSNTQFATAAAALAWPLAEWIIRGKPTVLGAISGAVAGLVAITPAAGFVSPVAALVIGAVSGFICFAGTSYLKQALGYDDALDAFGIHGIGGIWGAIATGLFFQVDANPVVVFLNPAIHEAIKAGTHNVLLNQIYAVLFTVVFSAVASGIILLVIKFTVGLRVSEDEEVSGLDVTIHGEEGYHGLT